MRKALQITKAFTRHYSDNEQTFAYIEWSDGSRTVDCCPYGTHMDALMKRAARDGLTITHERR